MAKRPCLRNTSISLPARQAAGPYPSGKIIVPVFCSCMIAARGLAAIAGDLVRRLISQKKFSDASTEPIGETLMRSTTHVSHYYL